MYGQCPFNFSWPLQLCHLKLIECDERTVMLGFNSEDKKFHKFIANLHYHGEVHRGNRTFEAAVSFHKTGKKCY